ncbi:MAG TPA: hypothetical protein VM841_02555 [Actinomycetota bacterium]|nr:hypothetical protein [Actinomycetota bacterium]
MTRAHGSFRFRLSAVLAAGAFVIAGAGPAMAEDPVPPDGGGSSGSSGAAPAQPVFQEGARILTDGQEARVLLPGKRSTLELTFHNQGSSDVRGAVAVAEHSSGATVAASRSEVGTIPAGGTAVARFDVTVDSETCTEFYGIGGQLTSDDLPEPAYFKAGFPVACPGARLSLGEVTIGGGDGDGIPEPGETVTLSVMLYNAGADPAKGVTARLRIQSKGVEVLTDTASWPDIASGETAWSLTPFVLRFAADAPRQEACSFDGREPGVVEPVPAPAEDKPGSSEPGAAGGGNPETPVSSDGNTGSGTASDTPLIEPAPPVGAEPAPMPMPAEPPREPEQPGEPGVAFEAMFQIETANDERFTLEFSNGMYCAYADGGDQKVDMGAGGTDAARLEASAPTGARSQGGPAVPAAAALLSVVAAMLVRQALTRGIRIPRPTRP